ncbi:MAG: hypothetical protein K0R89_2016, partial [Ramlibacter sp.]|nr:hypothetical protein [Ramlibacter sp.]
AQIAREKQASSRGAARYYVTLPFQGLWADPEIYEDRDLLAIVERVAGPEPVLCQLASDTPMKGSDFQPWHADTPALFPEWNNNNDTPSFQLAVNFALCDVNDDNGPFETTFGTHRMNKQEAMEGLASGAIAQHRLPMRMGDVMQPPLVPPSRSEHPRSAEHVGQAVADGPQSAALQPDRARRAGGATAGRKLSQLCLLKER